MEEPATTASGSPLQPLHGLQRQRLAPLQGNFLLLGRHFRTGSVYSSLIFIAPPGTMPDSRLH